MAKLLSKGVRRNGEEAVWVDTFAVTGNGFEVLGISAVIDIDIVNLTLLILIRSEHPL